jgi:hypothetical protein
MLSLVEVERQQYVVLYTRYYAYSRYCTLPANIYRSRSELTSTNRDTSIDETMSILKMNYLVYG